jgi:peptidoglycan hydrolase-like protein with peptidoglycan-binding domain
MEAFTLTNTPPTGGDVAEAIGDAPGPEVLRWPGATEEQMAFMRAVYALQIARAATARPFTGDTPAAELSVIEGSFVARTPAALGFRDLLAAARSELANAQLADASTAPRVAEVAVGRAYEAASSQLLDWQRAFPRYYAETAVVRGEQADGEHGQPAVAVTESHIAARQAAPGFGIHNRGLAVDFRTSDGDSLDPGADAPDPPAWRASWFARWLSDNAGRFGFEATLVDEPWHFEHRSEPPPAAASPDRGTAAEANVSYAESLGWGDWLDEVARLLGLSDTPAPGGVTEPVTQWQAQRGLDPDGVLGPQTWQAMQQVLVQQPPPALADTDGAVRANARYAASLGWDSRLGEIAALLGLNYTPAPAELVQAVASWQWQQGLTADGIIGPRTWSFMQQLLGPPAQPQPQPAPQPKSGGDFFKDDPTLQVVPLTAAIPVAIDRSWSPRRRKLAALYNRLGGLLTALAGATGIEVPAVLAIWDLESGGQLQIPGGATLRFENHRFWRLWGARNPDVFDQHFRFGTRGGQPGKLWESHEFREDPPGAWIVMHVPNGQELEYRALDLARRLGGDEIALQCASIGGPQIMMDQFRVLGYSSARAMWDAFQASERWQVLGFFDLCANRSGQNTTCGRLEPGGMLDYLRGRDWDSFACWYNGPGQVPFYSEQSRLRYEDAAQLPLRG